ncbi:MAG: Histone chaperone asf1 [Bathelium mastoideum]|nr:MAG: Histone chaperone asf1 [Bathelium mastoideum]
MSVVSVLNVAVHNNPAPFTAPYEFEITFECLEPLQKDLEWKLTYVGSATSSEHDQELDSLFVGPVPVGTNKFVFEADPPNLSRIPSAEILGVTVILLTCSYDGREFIRVGYYVNNEYTDEALNAEPPSKPIVEKVQRNILAEKPRVTRFAIKWDSEESAPAEFPPEQPEADTAEDDAANYGAEEEEEEAAEEAEAEGEPVAKVEVEDAEMGGTDETPALTATKDVKAENENEGEEEGDDNDDAKSEDIENESDDDDEEDEEGEEEGEGEGEGEADEEMDLGGEEAPSKGAEGQTQQGQAEILVAKRMPIERPTLKLVDIIEEKKQLASRRAAEGAEETSQHTIEEASPFAESPEAERQRNDSAAVTHFKALEGRTTQYAPPLPEDSSETIWDSSVTAENDPAHPSNLEVHSSPQEQRPIRDPQARSAHRSKYEKPLPPIPTENDPPSDTKAERYSKAQGKRVAQPAPSSPSKASKAEHPFTPQRHTLQPAQTPTSGASEASEVTDTEAIRPAVPARSPARLAGPSSPAQASEGSAIAEYARPIAATASAQSEPVLKRDEAEASSSTAASEQKAGPAEQAVEPEQPDESVTALPPMPPRRKSSRLELLQRLRRKS